jgi:hypothetical protein
MLWWSTPVFLAKGITLRLSHNPHPRDRRACLPNFITPHYIKNTSFASRAKTEEKRLKSCRGRVRTSTRQLAKTQSLVVNPGRPNARNSRLYVLVYPVILTPETRGHVCQKFHHPTVCFNELYVAILRQTPLSLKNLQHKF